MADNGPFKGVDEKEEEDAAEFALSLEEGRTARANLKVCKLVFQHSHRRNYLIFSLRVCIVNDLALIAVRSRPQQPQKPQGIAAMAQGEQ